MKTFEAKYPGRCAGCDDGISVGERLTYDGDDQVVHVDCSDTQQHARKPAEICPRCFTEKSVTGECSC